MKSLFAACGALSLVIPSVAQILIQRPETVKKKFNYGLIQGSTAAFGTPVYGDMILGQLVYGSPFNKSSPHCDSNYTLANTTYPKVVVVERGGCQFVEKVLSAQNGHDAAAVIVVDNDKARTSNDIRLVIMADDRWQKKDIRIPSVLISNLEGMTLIDELKNGTEILVRMEWDMPNEHTVNVDMWASPAIADTNKFLKKFAPVAREFKYDLDFVPHYWIFSLSPAGVDMNMCTDSRAKYCAFDPDLNGKLTGQDTVYESVRQYCLWSTTSTRNTSNPFSGRYSDHFWSYVELVGDRCPIVQNSPVAYLNEHCSYDLMRDLGVDVDKVKMCFRDDFERILDGQKSSLAWSPSALMINNYRYSGPLEADLIARAVCTGFHIQPQACEKALTLADPYAHEQTQKYFPWWAYVTIVAALFFVAITGVIAYRCFTMRLRRQLRYEVFEEVSNQLEKENKDSRGFSKTEVCTPDTLSREDANDKNFVDVIIV